MVNVMPLVRDQEAEYSFAALRLLPMPAHTHDALRGTSNRQRRVAHDLSLNDPTMVQAASSKTSLSVTVRLCRCSAPRWWSACCWQSTTATARPRRTSCRTTSPSWSSSSSASSSRPSPGAGDPSAGSSPRECSFAARHPGSSGRDGHALDCAVLALHEQHQVSSQCAPAEYCVAASFLTLQAQCPAVELKSC